MVAIFYRLSTLVLMRYLSFEEAALRRMRGGVGAGRQQQQQHHQQDDDGESSEDEGYSQPAATAGAAPGASPAGRGVSRGSSGSSNGGGGGSGVLSMSEFLRQKHQAYKSPALIVLEGIMDFSHTQFQAHISWIVPLLSRLVVCEDLEVRVCVRQIYQSFVNFLLIK